MQSGKEDLENTRGLTLTNKSSNSEDPTGQSRRQFIKTIGTLVFGVTLVDKTACPSFSCGPEPPPGCNNPGDNDASCDSPGDHDAGCGNGNKDEGCSASEPDENCHTNGPGGGEGDNDESCGAVAGLDEGCGDCNDEHDKDDNCGQLANGGTDPDDMCGHAHYWPFEGDKDNCCQNPGDNDQGCGKHDGPDINDWTDPDEGCSPGPPDTDQNCTGQEPDDDCSTNGGNTSTPDEGCSGGASYDEDQACEQWFDEDEACGHSDTDQDQGCGGEDHSRWPPHSDADQNCGNSAGGGSYDQDSQCGLKDGLGTAEDSACGNPIPGDGTDNDENAG